MKSFVALLPLLGIAIALPTAEPSIKDMGKRSPVRVLPNGFVIPNANQGIVGPGAPNAGFNPAAAAGGEAVGEPGLPEGAAGNGNENGLNVPENIDELAEDAAANFGGQDLGPDVFEGVLGAIP